MSRREFAAEPALSSAQHALDSRIVAPELRYPLCGESAAGSLSQTTREEAGPGRGPSLSNTRVRPASAFPANLGNFRRVRALAPPAEECAGGSFLARGDAIFDSGSRANSEKLDKRSSAALAGASPELPRHRNFIAPRASDNTHRDTRAKLYSS